MSETIVATRYAQALLSQALENKKVESLKVSVSRFIQAVQNSQDLKVVISDPRFREHRLSVLLEVADKLATGADFKSFLKILDDNDRISEFILIATTFLRLVDEQKGILCGNVTSAEILSEVEKRNLKETYSQLLHKDVQFNYINNPALIGGIVVKIADDVWDGSVLSQLNQLQLTLKGV